MPQLSIEFANSILKNQQFDACLDGVDSSLLIAVMTEWARVNQDQALNLASFGPFLSLIHDTFSVICANYSEIECKNIPTELFEILKKIINMNEAKESKLHLLSFAGEHWSPSYKKTPTRQSKAISEQSGTNTEIEKFVSQQEIDTYQRRLGIGKVALNKCRIDIHKTLAHISIQDRSRRKRTLQSYSPIQLGKNKDNSKIPLSETPAKDLLHTQLSKFERTRIAYLEINKRLQIAKERFFAMPKCKAESPRMGTAKIEHPISPSAGRKKRN